MTGRSATWDDRFLELADLVAGWSKDPRTQVGAVIVRPDKTVASVGFNGFPRGLADDVRLHDRSRKHELVVHAEMNAILHAREPLAGYTLYCTLAPCVRCAVHVVQAGIARVVHGAVHPDHGGAAAVFAEAGVEVAQLRRATPFVVDA